MTFDPLSIPLAQLSDEGGAAAGPGSDNTNSTTGQDSTPGDGNTAKEPGGFLGGSGFWILMLGMVVLWIFLLGGGSRKQKKKQAMMLASMAKGSKVITIGGIKGSVVEVRDDEVLVKVDESANTRLRFSKDAIRTVVSDSASGDSK
jgi:preprotein translocase subunit YajC